MYECINQPTSGTFHFVGAPGLFSLGAIAWNTSVTTYDARFNYKINIARFVDNFSFPFEIKAKGFNQAQFFLARGDRVWLTEDNLQNMDYSNDPVNITARSEIVLTRMSVNNEYVAQVSD